MQKFNAFDPILVRIHSNDVWSVDFYDYFDSTHAQHWTIAGKIIADSDILPYNEETKYLHGTVGKFTKWIPKKGEPILVRDYNNEDWLIRIFLGMKNNRYECTSYHAINYHINSSLWDQAKPYTNPFEE